MTNSSLGDKQLIVNMIYITMQNSNILLNKKIILKKKHIGIIILD